MNVFFDPGSNDFEHYHKFFHLNGEYITWNNWELINLAFDVEKNVWLFILVFSNLDLLKEKDLPFLNRIAKYLSNFIGTYIFFNDNPIYKVINESQVKFFTAIDEQYIIDSRISEEMKYSDVVYLRMDYKKYRDTLEYHKSNERLKTLTNLELKKFERIKNLRIKYSKELKYDLKSDTLDEVKYYPYIKIYYSVKHTKYGSIKYELVDGITMYFPLKKDRRTLLSQIRNHYIKIFEVDDKESLEMLIEDLEKVREDIFSEIKKINGKISQLPREKNKESWISYGESGYRKIDMIKMYNKMLKVTQECHNDVDEDILWLKEMENLIPGGEGYKEIVERQKKIKENPKEARKLYRESLKK